MPSPPTPPRADWTVIYDGHCGLCRTLLALLLSADRDHRLRPLALDTPEADRLLGDLTREQRNRSWHLIAPDGTRSSAGAAGAPVLELLPHGALPAAVLRRIPDTTESLYGLVAGNRTRIGPLIPAAIKQRATRTVERRTRESANRGGARTQGP